jgi:hypothetical protein
VGDGEGLGVSAARALPVKPKIESAIERVAESAPRPRRESMFLDSMVKSMQKVLVKIL